MTHDGDWADIKPAVPGLHNPYWLHVNGCEDLTYRVASMTEGLDEISVCVSKGGNAERLAEASAGLQTLLMVTELASGTYLHEASRDKIEKPMHRPSRVINGHIRVLDFDDVE